MHTSAASLVFSILLSAHSLYSPAVLRAEKQPIRLQIGERVVNVSGYDSLCAVYISVKELATALSLPLTENPERRKLELRLANHRIKISARNPFLIVTSITTGVSSSYQFPVNILFIENSYFAPATDFVALLERLQPSGVTLQAGTRKISEERPRNAGRYDITGAELEPYANGYLLAIKATRKLSNFEAFIAADGWLYVTVTDATADTAALSGFKPSDVIRRLQVYQYPTSVQLTFRVSPDIVQVDPIVDEKNNNLLLALHSRAYLDQVEREKKLQDQMQEKLQRARTKASLDVIVLDPGHGGKDPGTIGVNGTREKDVALGVALKLGKLIEQNLPEVKVVYTRKTDVFIELNERAKIANRENGKLFISIHCNSTYRKPSSANGFEIYIIRPDRTGRAIRSAESSLSVAERENKVIEYEEGYEARYAEVTNEETFILMTMRQSAFVRHSEDFAEKASEAMAKILKVQNRGVRQDGFYVLVYAAMPNVLVETGYLSNRSEERFLRSNEGQNKIAEALFEGILSFKDAYEKALNEGQPAEPQRD